jgi:hypothetical protein
MCVSLNLTNPPASVALALLGFGAAALAGTFFALDLWDICLGFFGIRAPWMRRLIEVNVNGGSPFC